MTTSPISPEDKGWNDTHLDTGAIVIVWHEDYGHGTNAIVVRRPAGGIARVLITNGKRKGTIANIGTDSLEFCNWVTGYSTGYTK